MMKRMLRATLVLSLGSVFFADCAHLQPPQGPPPPPLESSSVPFSEMPPSSAGPGPPAEERLGDANARELAQTRLVATACDANHRQVQSLVERQIANMREEVEMSWDAWRMRPECRGPFDLGAYRESGTLGLSGVGEGGGGRGEGVGLGSIGTIGSGSGQGFGSGHGRLGGSHSTTNNQVEGVGEADIVKNDGRYLYLALNGALRIVDAKSPRVISVTKLTSDVRQLLVEGNRAVIFTASGDSKGLANRASHRLGGRCTYGYDCTFVGDGTHTKIVVMDVADRAHPRVVRRLELSGALMASRAIGTAVHTVVADDDAGAGAPSYATDLADLPYCTTNEAAVRARFDRLKQENEHRIRASAPTFPTLSDNGRSRELCDAMRPSLDEGFAFTTLVSFDMESDRDPPVTSTVQTRPGAVFASEDALYLSVRHQRERFDQRWYGFYGSIDELSDIHKFRIGRLPSETRYVGTGVVTGHVLNQFAMDERHGYLRVATTRGRVPDPSVESAVSILAENEDGNLARVGAIEHIAPSEDIRSVRFDGDRGYVVTFKKTDPLFVLDLANPSEPRILGELKIPGFSTYLHRIDPTHLLSIGFDAEDHGSFAYFGGIILQLFDVTNPIAPELLYKERIGTRGSSSEAATDHLAFNYLAERGLLAVPLTVCEGGGNGRFGIRKSFSGLSLYNVDAKQGFRRLGTIDHGKHNGQDATCSTWWSRATSAVKRSVFVDELVFSIATDRIKVQRMNQLGTDVAEIALTP